MIRLILGWILIAAGAIVWFAPDEPVGFRAGASAAYGVIGAILVYFGRRARRREKSSLSYAAKSGDVAGIRDRLALDPDAKEKNAALNKACQRGHIDVVREILALHMDVNAAWWEQTPLVAAIRGGHRDIVELLFEHGADVSGQAQERPLTAAIQHGHLDLVELLIKRGVDVNAADGEGTTPLIVAADDGRAAIVRLLLDAGADPNHENMWGHTALYRAGSVLTIGKKPDVVVELINAGAEMGGRIFPRKLSMLGGVDRENPVAWGVATGMRDKGGNTLLMIAASAGRRRAVQRLLSEVPLDAVNRAGETALALAQAAGHQVIARELRETGRSTIRA